MTVAERENAHVARMCKVQAAVRAAALADGELILRDLFEDSQYREEVTERIREEVEEELREDLRPDIEKAIRADVLSAVEEALR